MLQAEHQSQQPLKREPDFVEVGKRHHGQASNQTLQVHPFPIQEFNQPNTPN